MSIEQRLSEILEQILDEDIDPVVACGADTDLLPLVRQRLLQLQQVNQSLNDLFPDSASPNSPAIHSRSLAEPQLPQIVGYQVISILGHGGMGVVYKAKHEKLNRFVALKMLRSGHFATSSELTRFAREYQAIAELHCPHIIQIYDIGDADGRPYFTMELAENGSLAERLNGIPQPALEAAQIAASLAEAIDSAHQKGIVHRDLKPGNILFAEDGGPKIADFGLSLHLKSDRQVTLSQVQIGTPSYMAPEQAMSKSDSLNHRVDIYGIGAILYEMLTGRPPFRAETSVETLRQVLHEEVASPSRINTSIPRDIETICLKCLMKQPDMRYSSAKELADDLRRFLRHEPIRARPLGLPERCWRVIKRNPATIGLVFSLFSIACLISVIALREFAASRQRDIELESWRQRINLVQQLEQQGRFAEAQRMLGQGPTASSRDARELIAATQKELNLAEQLDAIRMSRGKFTQGGGIDYEESSHLYEAAFRDAKIGSVSEKPDLVASRIKNSFIFVAIVSALDDWAVCANPELRAWILEVARRADPDLWRDQMRDQARWADLDHLQTLADGAVIEQQPVTALVAMGTRWRRLGGNPSDFLRRVHRVYPFDFWVNFELSVLNASSSDEMALSYNLAALSIRPDAASVHYNLASAYQRLGRVEDATFHFRKAVELDPNHSWAFYKLAICLFDSGQSQAAIEHFQRSLTIDPNYVDARNGLRMALIKLGRLEEAKIIWEATFLLSTVSHSDLDGFAELCLYLGDEDKYNWACQQLLSRFGDSQDPFICERIGRTCILRPSDEKIEQTAVALVDRALSTPLRKEEMWGKPYFQLTKAMCDYRTGSFDDAILRLDADVLSVLPPIPELVLALALSKTGNQQEAIHRLQHLKSDHKPSEINNSREAWISKILRFELEQNLQ